MNRRFALTILLTALAATSVNAQVTLLNVSYDPTRELYQEVNAVFARQWESKSGQKLSIRQSHG